jgi:2-polyprenyl-3-methyl-5-hydroxy-6-metoxy-1,4-benzoquinol methylase
VSRPDWYFHLDRADLVDQLPVPAGRVLDVGCAAGGVGRRLLARGATSVVGVEIDPEMAAVAREAYADVRVGDAVEQLGALEGPFDTVVLYDVLEHLVDPWAALRRCAEIAAPGARLHVSVPNVRHASVLYDLVLRGTFGYTDWGHRDITHLRWFTPGDLKRAVRDAGWEVLATTHTPLSRPRRLVGRLTGGRSDEFLAYQWQVLGRRA